MDDRIRGPLPVAAIDPEPLEQLPLAQEELLEGVAQQQFSEPTGTGEEIKFIHSRTETIINLLCFINVSTVACANVGEIRKTFKNFCFHETP